MKALVINETNARAFYKDAPPALKASFEDTFGKDFFSQKITDRIKTFEDACAELGIDLDTSAVKSISVPQALTNDAASILAYSKLTIIARALNEGWVPDWKNSSQYKYYPWFKANAGSGLSFCGYGCANAGTRVGSRLCFKTSELAEYAGKQFEGLYNEFLTIK
jgi:hypothetical protein